MYFWLYPLKPLDWIDLMMRCVHGRLRRQILGVLGISLLAPACADDAVVGDDGAGEGTAR